MAHLALRSTGMRHNSSSYAALRSPGHSPPSRRINTELMKRSLIHRHRGIQRPTGSINGRNGQLRPRPQESHQERDEVDLVHRIQRLVRGLSTTGPVSSHHVYDNDLDGTHDKHQKIVITVTANSFTRRVAFSGADFGFNSSWSSIDEICRGH